MTALGQIVGIASTTDLLRVVLDLREGEEPRETRAPKLSDGFHATRIARTRVGEIMTPFAFSLPDSASVQQAAALMAYEGVSQIPVTGASGRFVGMLSSLDVMGWLARQGTSIARLPDVVASPIRALEDEWERDPPDERRRAHDRWSEIRLLARGEPRAVQEGSYE